MPKQKISVDHLTFIFKKKGKFFFKAAIFVNFLDGKLFALN